MLYIYTFCCFDPLTLALITQQKTLRFCRASKARGKLGFYQLLFVNEKKIFEHKKQDQH
jgi:hypothetical protein